MKKLFLSAVIGACCLTACDNKQPVTNQQSYNQGINIIPQPQSLEQGEGSFQLKKNTVFYAQDAGARTVAEFIAGKLNLSTGFTLQVTDQISSFIYNAPFTFDFHARKPFAKK